VMEQPARLSNCTLRLNSKILLISADYADYGFSREHLQKGKRVIGRVTLFLN
jgi:hypothetical protein